jgi:putative membrane protein
MWQMTGVGWGWWLVAAIVDVVLWLVIIYGAVSLIRAIRTRNRLPRDAEAARPAPRDVLDHRLARGELTVDEYERRRRLLETEPHRRARARRS